MSVSIDIRKLKPTIAEFDFNKYKKKFNRTKCFTKRKVSKW